MVDKREENKEKGQRELRKRKSEKQWAVAVFSLWFAVLNIHT